MEGKGEVGGEEQDGLHGRDADKANAKGSLLQQRRLPTHPPQLPRQQLILKSSHDFSITRPIHPYTFFYHCVYPSIRLSVLFYHHFHPSIHP